MVDQRHHEVLLAQDAVGDVVGGELVLDDAQARGLLQVDDALHDR